MHTPITRARARERPNSMHLSLPIRVPMDIEQSSATPNAGIRPSRYGLTQHGIRNINIAYWNLGTAQRPARSAAYQGLVRYRRRFCRRPPVIFTGRSPKDKFVVRDESTETTVQWGPVNQPDGSGRLRSPLLEGVQHVGRVTTSSCRTVSPGRPRYQLPIQVITRIRLAQLVCAATSSGPTDEERKTTCPNSPSVRAAFPPTRRRRHQLGSVYHRQFHASRWS